MTPGIRTNQRDAQETTRRKTHGTSEYIVSRHPLAPATWIPARVVRASRSKRTRGKAVELPIFIRAVGIPIADSDREYLRRKLRRQLDKFARSVERASVRIEDLNRDRGGIDKRCRIKVVLHDLPSVVVAEHHHSPRAAMDRALHRTETAVRRSVQRRRSRLAPRTPKRAASGEP